MWHVFRTLLCLYMPVMCVWKEGQLSQLIHCWVPGGDVYTRLPGARLTDGSSLPGTIWKHDTSYEPKNLTVD